MSSYKSKVIEDGAVSLWTFDGDPFDISSRKLLVYPDDQGELSPIIIDEIDMMNPAILHNDESNNGTYLPGYRLGMSSLVPHEQSDSKSISFGFHGYVEDHPSHYPKAFIEVPHSLTYSFPDYGSFSVEMFFFKERMHEALSDNLTSYTRPIIKKQGVFEVCFLFSQYENSLLVSHPGGAIPHISLTDYIDKYDLIGQTIHFVLTWHVFSISETRCKGVAKVYINGYIASEQTYFYEDTLFPKTNVNTPFYIAGNPENSIAKDWHTSNFQIDQVAIFDKALTDDQVAKHLAAAFPYNDLVQKHFAVNYWTFNDLNDINDYSVKPSIGYLVGYTTPNQSLTIRRSTGPINFPTEKSTKFTDGMATFLQIDGNGNPVVRQINSPYTYEFWFTVTGSKKSVLFSFQSFNYPFNGLLVQANMSNNNEVVGKIQMSEGYDMRPLSSMDVDSNQRRFNFSDGNWHHIVVLRRASGMLELWLDGVLHDSGIYPIRQTVNYPGQICVMNAAPGGLAVNGSFCKLAYYPYALQAHQIKSHATYSIIHRVRGIVTLMGIPYKATVRFYNSTTGEFIQEVESDVNTGEYNASFLNDATVDIFVFNPNDRSVRYRAYGPVSPSSFLDLPMVI